MKILHVTPYFYPAWSYGGTPRVVYDLCRELVSIGHEVSVWTTDAFSAEKRLEVSEREEVICGIKVRRFRNLSNRLAYRGQVYLPLGFGTAVGRRIGQFDIVHLNGYRNFLNDISFRGLRRERVPYVFSAHGSVLPVMHKVLLKRLYDRVLGRRILRHAAGLIAITSLEAEEYVSMGVDRERIRVIPNGLDTEEFTALPAPGSFRRKYGLEGAQLVLFMGRVHAQKGLDFLVRAFASFLDSGARKAVLTVCGSDEGYGPELRRIAGELGIGSSVVQTGLLEERERLAAYRDADLVVYPSPVEVFGLVPFESMLCGTPVIVTEGSGCGAILKEASAGWLVGFGDAAGLAKRIAYALAHGEEGMEMVERGKNYIASHFKWDALAAQMSGFYTEIVAGSDNRKHEPLVLSKSREVAGE